MLSMRTSLLLIISALALIAGVGAATCPASGVECYPSDCCSQYRQCSGSTFYAVQNTPAGTVCKGGQIVWPSDCTTPCSGAAPVTGAPTTQKPTAAATQKPTTPATPAPEDEDCEEDEPTSAPTQKATSAPATSRPSTAPTQKATSAPVTSTPTQKATSAPVTSAPTQKATAAPATSAPTQKATSAPATTKPGSCSLAEIFSQADFDALFPHANGGSINGLPNQHPIFTYSNIIAAAAYYPTFACTGDVATRKRELAAFLAHSSQESSGWWAGQPYNWGYYFSTEVGCTNALCTMYCDPWNTQYPCVTGKSYYGRGPIQLSWNYNYGAASQAIFGDSKVLLNDPDQIFSSGVTAYRTAFWFWMTAQGPKPSCHDVMAGVFTPSTQDRTAGRLSGFGLTTNIINGGIECNHATPQQVINRVSYFQVYTARFGVTAGDNLYCDKMQSY